MTRGVVIAAARSGAGKTTVALGLMRAFARHAAKRAFAREPVSDEPPLKVLVGLLVARYLGPARLGSLSYCLALVTLIGFVPSPG